MQTFGIPLKRILIIWWIKFIILFDKNGWKYFTDNHSRRFSIYNRIYIQFEWRLRRSVKKSRSRIECHERRAGCWWQGRGSCSRFLSSGRIREVCETAAPVLSPAFHILNKNRRCDFRMLTFKDDIVTYARDVDTRTSYKFQEQLLPLHLLVPGAQQSASINTLVLRRRDFLRTRVSDYENSDASYVARDTWRQVNQCVSVYV